MKNGPTLENKEIKIPTTNTAAAVELLGEGGKHGKFLEKEIGVKVIHHGDHIIVNGPDAQVDLAADLISQLYTLIDNGETLFESDFGRALKMLSGNKNLKIDELFKDQIKISGRKSPIVPKTFKQKQYLEAIKSHDIIFGVGPAGTGKTYLGMAMAVSALLNKDVKRIILCRPAIEAGEKLGFLPGDMAEKVNPYLRPLYDAIHDMVDAEKVQEMITKGMIEVAPLAFMRGRTLSRSFVILDEAQNTTASQMKMFLTRLGFGSKCVITGDPTQVDLPRGIISGLDDALEIVQNIPDIAITEFSEVDVIRHPLVGKIVAGYAARDKKFGNA